MRERSRLVKALYVLAGLFFVGLGTLGMLLPVLPTTIFMILAAVMFLRSSDRLYQWVISRKSFGPAVKLFLEERAISRKGRRVSLTAMWSMIVLSGILTWRIWFVPLILLALGAIGTWYMVSLKAVGPDLQTEAGEAAGPPA
jgi:uncharacterized membrane protein YbaN (DUF454 family)